MMILKIYVTNLILFAFSLGVVALVKSTNRKMYEQWEKSWPAGAWCLYFASTLASIPTYAIYILWTVKW